MLPDGDWFPPSNGQKGSTELVSAATFIQDARHVAAMAGAVGDAKTQARLAGGENRQASLYCSLLDWPPCDRMLGLGCATALAATLLAEFTAAFGPHSQGDPGLADNADGRARAPWDGKIGNGGQTDVGTALWLGAVPNATRAAVVEALVRDIEAHGCHSLATGGAAVLADNDSSDSKVSM